jgi:hypothetical protein
MSRVLCETWDSTAHPSEDLGSATAGKGTTSVAPQARKRGNRRADCRKMTHAQPWKSGASAPRKAPKEATGLQPQWTFLGFGSATTREGRDTIRAAHLLETKLIHPRPDLLWAGRTKSYVVPAGPGGRTCPLGTVTSLPFPPLGPIC